MLPLNRGDVVCDLDKDPESSPNRGKVEEAERSCASDLEKRHDERSTTAKARKVSAHGWAFAIPPSVRKEIRDKFSRVSDEEIDAEIARLIGCSTGADD